MSQGLSRRQLYVRINYASADIGLDRMDRLSLAQELLEGRHDLESFTELTVDELEDMWFVLKSYRLIHRMRLGNGAFAAECKVFRERLDESAYDAAERQTRDDSWD